MHYKPLESAALAASANTSFTLSDLFSREWIVLSLLQGKIILLSVFIRQGSIEVPFRTVILVVYYLNHGAFSKLLALSSPNPGLVLVPSKGVVNPSPALDVISVRISSSSS